MTRRGSLPEWADAYDLSVPDDAAMVERARHKLQELLERRVPLRPAGWFVGRVVSLALLGVLPPAGLLLLILLIEIDSPETRTVLLAILGPVLGAWLIWSCFRIAGSRANTPRRALELYYRSLARAQFEKAASLVVPNDFDAFPRWFPDLQDFSGPPPSEVLFFDDAEEYADYWRALLRSRAMPYCVVRVRALISEEVAPGIILCDYELSLITNTLLWILLIFIPYVGLIVAALADYFTRKRIRLRMTKVLVRADNEWLLFNGAWHEPDEEDLSWLPEPEGSAA